MLKRFLILVLGLFLFFPVLNVNALTYIRDTEQSVIWDKEDIISKEDKNILEEYNLKLSAGNYEAPKLQFALIGDSNIKTRPRDEEFKTIYDSWGLGKKTITNYSILLKGGISMFPLLGAVAWGAFAEGVTLGVSVYQAVRSRD